METGNGCDKAYDIYVSANTILYNAIRELFFKSNVDNHSVLLLVNFFRRINSLHPQGTCHSSYPEYTYLLTPWSRILLEKLNGLQLVKKFFAFYGTRRFITTFISARHLFLSWTSSIQSIPQTSHFLKIHFIIILSSTPGSPQRYLEYSDKN